MIKKIVDIDNLHNYILIIVMQFVLLFSQTQYEA